jgi:hypothetical protein
MMKTLLARLRKKHGFIYSRRGSEAVKKSKKGELISFHPSFIQQSQGPVPKLEQFEPKIAGQRARPRLKVSPLLVNGGGGVDYPLAPVKIDMTKVIWCVDM